MQKSGEDYLEAILVQEIKHDSPCVRSTDIARHLGVSKPSVSRAMSNLKAAGYIEMESYGEVRLSVKGRAVAEEVYERHRMLTRFLRDKGRDEQITFEQITDELVTLIFNATAGNW